MTLSTFLTATYLLKARYNLFCAESAVKPQSVISQSVSYSCQSNQDYTGSSVEVLATEESLRKKESFQFL